MVSNADQKKFKEWIKDTVKVISRDTVSTKIIVEPDSTFLELNKQYYLTVKPNQNFTDRDVLNAIATLESNDTIPKEDFLLSFQVNHFFEVGNDHLDYFHEYELENFEVKTSNVEKQYRFVRANMVDKKVIHK